MIIHYNTENGMNARLEEILNEIHQIEWNLVSGAYAHYSDEMMTPVVDRLFSLKNQAEEITASLINPEDLPF